MKTSMLYNELINKGVKCEMVSTFSYVFDKNRRFNTIFINDVLTAEASELIINSGHTHTTTVMNYLNGERRILIEVSPIKGSENIEWND